MGRFYIKLLMSIFIRENASRLVICKSKDGDIFKSKNRFSDAFNTFVNSGCAKKDNKSQVIGFFDKIEINTEVV